MIFSERSYGPAEDDLRVLAAYVLLVYFSMHLSTCLTSSGHQVAWTVVQGVCVIVSVVCDPPLILWFQAHTGNGSLGVCVASVVSEILMVGAGVYLLPTGILDKALLHKLGTALLAGAVMVLVARVLPLDSFARAIAAVLAYLGCLWLTGALQMHEIQSLLGLLRRRRP
jgi:Na+-driven multidrug efflux pump